MYQPDYPAAIGLLSHLNSDELKEILNDDSKFESLVKDVKQLKDWETEKEMIVASNKSLAEFNLAKEPEYLEAKERISANSEKGEELCKNVQEKLDIFKSKSGGVSLDTTLALLETAAAQSEEESENIAQKFLGGELDIDKFLEDFTKERKTMHLRKVKVEKMNELINNKHQPQSQGYGNPQPTPYPIYPGNPYPGQQQRYYPPAPMPYPTGPMNMPMPGAYRNHF